MVFDVILEGYIQVCTVFHVQFAWPLLWTYLDGRYVTETIDALVTLPEHCLLWVSLFIAVDNRRVLGELHGVDILLQSLAVSHILCVKVFLSSSQRAFGFFGLEQVANPDFCLDTQGAFK